MHRRDFAYSVWPIPVRQNVSHRQVGSPSRLVQVEAVFLEAREINNAAIRASRSVVWRRFTNIIEARPHEFAAHVRIPVLSRKHFVRRRAEVCRVQFVRAHLGQGLVAARGIVDGCSPIVSHREEEGAARAQRRSRLARPYELFRLVLVEDTVRRRRASTVGAGVVWGVSDSFALVIDAQDVHDLWESSTVVARLRHIHGSC